VSGAEVYKVWCMAFRAVSHTHFDSLYGHFNKDLITIPSGETEKVWL
jgi:hypothetical protein